MTRSTAHLVLAFLILCATWFARDAAAWSVTCGQEGAAPCTFSKARFEGAQTGLCPAGQIFDLTDGGTCWTCPAGTGRTVFPITGPRACERVATTEHHRASRHARGTGLFGTVCPDGQFWDVSDGHCYSCPQGFAMQVLESVDSPRKCARSIPATFSRATQIGPPCGVGSFWDPRRGGECWSCPDGFARTVAPVTSDLACESSPAHGGIALNTCQRGWRNIRGTCRRTGECGREGQRPCEVDERLPSCDPGLREDFKRNECVALRPGETPFTAGLSSLAGYWGAALQHHCRELLGGVELHFEGDFGVGARCGRDVAVGAVCAFLRDTAASPTDLVNRLLELVPGVPDLAGQMNDAANSSECRNFGERFSPATRHRRATGAVLPIDCPAGQFWDPDGFCYSCPDGTTRTAFPVTDARACTDRIGGNLVQFGCGAFQGLQTAFDQPLDCTVEVLENGSIFDRPLDLSQADQAVCTATGELGYTLLALGPRVAQAAVTGDVTSILEVIGTVTGLATDGLELNRLLECRRGQ